MFHVMLILIPLIFIVILGSIVLFGVVSIIASVVGSASVALFVKDKTTKYLLFVGCSIVLFVGSLCVLPLVTVSLKVEYHLFLIISMIILIIIGLLAVLGVRLTIVLKNKMLRTILSSVFIIVIILALVCIGFVYYFYQ